MLTVACAPTGGGFGIVSSCPTVVGEDLGIPSKQTELSAGGARCYNAVVGVLTKRVSGSSTPELIFTGQNGRTYQVPVPSVDKASRETIISLTVPAAERLTKVRLQSGGKTVTASL